MQLVVLVKVHRQPFMGEKKIERALDKPEARRPMPHSVLVHCPSCLSPEHPYIRLFSFVTRDDSDHPEREVTVTQDNYSST